MQPLVVVLVWTGSDHKTRRMDIGGGFASVLSYPFAEGQLVWDASDLTDRSLGLRLETVALNWWMFRLATKQFYSVSFGFQIKFLPASSLQSNWSFVIYSVGRVALERIANFAYPQPPVTHIVGSLSLHPVEKLLRRAVRPAELMKIQGDDFW